MKLLKYLAILAAAGALDSCSLNLLAPKYTVGGTITGLTGTGLAGAGLVLQVNSGDNLSIVQNGSFTFGSSIAKGDTYTVTVATQPTNPVETCNVYNGSGTISNVDIGNVIVTCVQTGQFAYVANQTDDTISAFVIDSTTGALGLVSGSPFATGGIAPVAVAVDPNGVYLYAVENGSNEVAVFTIDAASGALTATALAIATGNSPAAIAIHPNNQYAYVANSADDTLTAYTLSSGVATPISGANYIVGVDPVDVKIDPSGNYLYVANYSDGTVSAFTVDYATGELTAITGSPFTAGGSGNETVSLAIDPTDTFLYAANLKTATISAFSIGTGTGTLVPTSSPTLSTGSSPESLAVNPGGNFLYAANVTADDEVAPYGITATSGALSVGTPVATGTFPASVVVDPMGQFVYVANYGSHSVSVYTVNAAAGALTPVKGSPFASGNGPRAIAIDPVD
jgi:6-phosphogluconolactonase (cycloisomerase 2 family)